jgi:hypothetical protein
MIWFCDCVTGRGLQLDPTQAISTWNKRDLVRQTLCWYARSVQRLVSLERNDNPSRQLRYGDAGRRNHGDPRPRVAVCSPPPRAGSSIGVCAGAASHLLALDAAICIFARVEYSVARSVASETRSWIRLVNASREGGGGCLLQGRHS